MAAAFQEYAPKAAEKFWPFERFLAESEGRQYFVGSKLTVADLAVFDLFDLHLRLWGQSSLAAKNGFEKLHAHRVLISNIPTIAAYLSSDRRWSRINGNMLG